MKIQQSLHILHLTDGNRGGSQRHIIDLCHDDATDVRHFVLRIADGALSVHDAAHERVLVTATFPDDAAVMEMVRRAIRELAIDVVHAHALPVLLKVAEAPGRPLAGVPLVVTLHDLGCIDAQLFVQPTAQPRADPRWVARCAPVLRQAAAVIVPSDFLAELVKTHYPDVHPLVIANGIGLVPAVQLPVSRTSPPWPQNARVFAVVGALGPHKGSETLLRVAAALTRDDSVGVVIGYTDAQLTSGWAVPGRLFVHGRYAPDELPGLLAGYQARFAYFPNLIPESFSYALSEVWQAGIPALVPAGGALGDRVRTTGAGWLLDDPLDAIAAATEIERLLSSAGGAEVAAASARIARPGAVPDVAAMRAAVGQVYRALAAASVGDADAGWTQLRASLRPQLLSSIDDCALDAELPALVREERTLRDWGGKLAGDVAMLDASAHEIQSALQDCVERSDRLETDVQLLKARNEKVEADSAVLAENNTRLGARNAELESGVAGLRRRNLDVEEQIVTLRARNAHVEADAAALGRRNIQLEGDLVGLTQRHIELETDIVALKERNTLVEADLFALKQRNTHVERDAVALQHELTGTREHVARIELDLAEQRARTARFQRALSFLPGPFHNWLVRHDR